MWFSAVVQTVLRVFKNVPRNTINTISLLTSAILSLYTPLSYGAVRLFYLAINLIFQFVAQHFIAQYNW